MLRLCVAAFPFLFFYRKEGCTDRDIFFLIMCSKLLLQVPNTPNVGTIANIQV